jgi:membrane protease YdiL (CAAX protease family)
MVLDPGYGSYLLAVGVTGGLGAFAVAADLYARWLSALPLRVLDVYAGVLTVAVLAGLVVLGPAAVVGSATSGWLVAVPAGVMAGGIAWGADRAILRAWRRRGARRLVRGASRPGATPPARPVTPTPGALLLGGTRPRRRTAAPGPAGFAVTAAEFRLGTVVAVAVLEELFFRGVLLAAARQAGGMLAVVLSVGTLVAFLLSHLPFGVIHLAAKTPLGVLALGLTVVTGAVAAAVVTHVVFNVAVWRRLPREPR